MDFLAGLGGHTLGQVATAIVKEGGGTLAGFGGAGVLGRRIENALMGNTPVSSVSTSWDKAKGYLANNVPKILAWWYLRGKALPGSVLEDVDKGIITNVAFDTAARLSQGGVPTRLTIAGFDIMSGEPVGSVPGMDPNAQAVIARLQSEVASLQAQLRSTGIQQMPYRPPGAPPAYVGGVESSQVLPPEMRQKRFGAMQRPGPGTHYPGATIPQQRFGTMGSHVAAADIASMFKAAGMNIRA